MPIRTPDPARLDRIVRSVRRRWRLRMAIRGIAIVLAAALVTFFGSSLGLEHFRFSPTAITAFRVVAYGTVAILAVRFLLRPLLRRVTNEQVALYLEEHEPSLQGQVLTAIEYGPEPSHASPTIVSRALIERLVERAIEGCAAVDDGRRVEQPGLRRWGGALSGATAAGALLLLLQPGFVSHSAPFLLRPWAAGPTDNPFAVAVLPGDTVLPRGADLAVSARLRNFDASVVEIGLRRGSAAEWERWPMIPDDDGTYEFMVFNVDSATEYFVEASGVRSSIYRVDVRDLPYVSRIDLEYEFPAYTGLSPVTEEDGGDIAALRGTTVRFAVATTMAVAGGRLVVGERDTIPLERADPTALAGALTVDQEGFYRILLETQQGELVVGSPDYYIDPLSDQPPTVRVSEPGRDVSVTNIDEVFTEVIAEDDYGLGAVELVYAVNGGPAQTERLYDGSGRRQALTAGHTFYLEEHGLQPGDIVSYFARAGDERSDATASTTTSDIYFIQIRPFDRRYRQAESQGGQPGGAGNGSSAGELAQRQRQIVAATFNVTRDSATLEPDEIRENLATLALAQGRLREEVETLIQRIAGRRVVETDSTFQAVAAALPPAVDAMREAEERLGERRPQDALSPEQRALQFLQRAEAAFREREVSQGGGGGGGGGQSASAEDLADLFDLELDKLRNQYEEVDRGRQEQAAQQVDELLEKLQELARRQQQENERLRARAQNPGGTSGGGDSQRQLAEEAEEAARQLERLSRDRSQPELAESARRLREAVDAMRRAAAAGNDDAAARGQNALDRLREARRRLEENRSAELERSIQDALQRAERLREEQTEVVGAVEQLGARPGDSDRLRRIVERKEEMADQVQELESDLVGLSRQAREEQPEAARKLDEATRQLRDDRLADKILYSRGVVQGRSADYARNFEEQIGTDLEQLEQRIREALEAVGESPERRLAESLDRTRELVNALESLEDRAREQQGQQDQQDQQGQQGQQGRQGQRGMQRQFQRELQFRRGELDQLRRDLGQLGVNTDRLDRIARGLGTLQNTNPFADPRGLDRLESEIIAGLKDFEYQLRRQLVEADGRQPFLSGSEDVPPEYRSLVEEYYRALSRIRR